MVAVALLLVAIQQVSRRWGEVVSNRPSSELTVYHEMLSVNAETRRQFREGAERLARFDSAGARDTFQLAVASSRGNVAGEALAWDGVARAQSALGEVGRAAGAARRASALVASRATELPPDEVERIRARALAADRNWKTAVYVAVRTATHNSRPATEADLWVNRQRFRRNGVALASTLEIRGDPPRLYVERQAGDGTLFSDVLRPHNPTIVHGRRMNLGFEFRTVPAVDDESPTRKDRWKAHARNTGRESLLGSEVGTPVSAFSPAATHLRMRWNSTFTRRLVLHRRRHWVPACPAIRPAKQFKSHFAPHPGLSGYGSPRRGEHQASTSLVR